MAVPHSEHFTAILHQNAMLSSVYLQVVGLNLTRPPVHGSKLLKEHSLESLTIKFGLGRS